MSSKAQRRFARYLVECGIRESSEIQDCLDPSLVIVAPSFRGRLLERASRPRLELLLDKLCESRDRLLVANAHLTLRQRRAMRRFHLASDFIVSLLRGLAD